MDGFNSMIPNAIRKLENVKMKCTIAGFLNDDLLNLCDFLRLEKYKKVEISNHTKDILYPPPTYTKVMCSKSKFFKD